MKKYRCLFILFSLLLFFKVSFSQVYKYFIYDTIHVHWFYQPSDPVNDTNYFVKYGYPRGIIYWDSAFKFKYRTSGTNVFGSDTTWFKNGHISEIATRKKLGSLSAFFVNAWYNDGNRKIETVFNKEIETETFYYHNGRVAGRYISKGKITSGEEDSLNDFIWIYQEFFCKNGTLVFHDSVNQVSKYPYLCTTYYCNGNKESESLFYFGTGRFGKYQNWYENGQLNEEGQFDDTTSFISHSWRLGNQPKKQGVWKFFNESGKLIKETEYKDGEVVNERKYF